MNTGEAHAVAPATRVRVRGVGVVRAIRASEVRPGAVVYDAFGWEVRVSEVKPAPAGLVAIIGSRGRGQGVACEFRRGPDTLVGLVRPASTS